MFLVIIILYFTSTQVRFFEIHEHYVISFDWRDVIEVIARLNYWDSKFICAVFLILNRFIQK